MSTRTSVVFASSAQDDLRDVIEWYAAKQVPQVGRRLVAEVVYRIEQLADFPESGRVVPEFEVEWLREIEHSPFRIVYRRDESAVVIVRVWRGERSLRLDPEDDTRP